MFTIRKLSKLVVLPLGALLMATTVLAADATTTTTTTTTGTTPPTEVDHSKTRVQNGPSVFKGNIQTSQHIYYPGDPLSISVQFARGSDLLASGQATAFVVIYSFDGTATTVPVPKDVGTNPRQFFKLNSVDTKTLKEGQYQLGLVVTAPGGSALKLTDWYSGFRGLLDTQAILVSSTAVAGDKNHTGEFDNDTNHNGIDDDGGTTTTTGGTTSGGSTSGGGSNSGSTSGK